MDLFKLFRPRQAATFAAEPINPEVLPGSEACNCPDVLFNGDQAAEIKSMGQGDNESKRKYHTAISSKLRDIFFGGDNEAAAQTLTQMQRSQPVPNDSEEKKRHILMHFDGAGVTPGDLGYTENQLSPQYRAGRELAESAQQGGIPTDYDADHCGTCLSYETALKTHANKLSQAMDRSAEDLPESQKPYAQMSVKGLFQRMWDSWTNREPVKDDDHPLVKEGNDILNNWNRHTESGHSFSLDPYASVRNTPMSSGLEGKTRMENLYRKLKDIKPGWSFKRRTDIPENPIGLKTEEQLSGLYPYQPDRDIATKGFIPPVSRQEHAEALSIAEQMKERGELNEYTNISELPTPRVTESTEPKRVLLYDKEKNKHYTLTEINPISYDMSGNPVTPQQVIETENFTGVSRGPNRALLPKPLGYEQTYDPFAFLTEEPGRRVDPRKNWLTRPVTYDTDRPEIVQTYTDHKDENGVCQHPSHKSDEQKASCEGYHADDINDLYSIPREDAFLFQRAGVKPDLAAHKQYQRDTVDYQAQPTKRQVGEETVPKMDYGTKTVTLPKVLQRIPLTKKNPATGNFEGGEVTYTEPFTDDEFKKNLLANSKLIVEDPIFGAQRAWRETPEGHKIGESEVYRDEKGAPIFHPTETHEAEVTDYDAGLKPVLDESGKQVMETRPVYEDIPESERMPKPSADKAIANYDESYNRALATAYPGMSRDDALDALYNEHQSKISELASRTERYRTSSKKEDNMFNSSNNKEAHIDPSAVAHGLEAITHAIGHGIHAVGDWAHRIGEDMDHPTSTQFTGDPKHLHELQQQAQAFKEMEPNGGMGRTIADQNLQAYTDRNSQTDINGVGAVLDAANILGIGKVIGDRLKRHSSFNERFATEKKPCSDCGKSCKDKVECKQNQDERRRQNAAENSSY